MFLLKILFFLVVSLIYQLILTEGAWAWGPAIHTVIGCTILDGVSHIFPPVAKVIELFPMEYLYGSLSADFFVGKGQKRKNGHSHNWDTGFRFFDETRDDRDTAYAYGFLSHLAADVVAHNYYVPNLIRSVSAWKRMGHIYVEAKADQFVGPVYTRIARDLLSREELGCDDLLRSAVGTSRNGFKTRKHLFTQTVKLSDFLNCSQPIGTVSNGSRFKISQEYLYSRLESPFLRNCGRGGEKSVHRPLFHVNREAVGKRPSAIRQAHGPEQSRRAALPSSLVTAAYFYVRLIPRDLSALRLDSPPCGRVPSFGSSRPANGIYDRAGFRRAQLAYGHFPSCNLE
jgi:hypothetical protein